MESIVTKKQLNGTRRFIAFGARGLIAGDDELDIRFQRFPSAFAAFLMKLIVHFLTSEGIVERPHHVLEGFSQLGRDIHVVLAEGDC